MNSDIKISIPPPFQTVDDVLGGLCQLEAAFVAAGDRRGVFTTAYVVTTTTFKDWIDHQRFLQNELVARYVVAFGNAYRDALAADARGLQTLVPAAWRQSFDACRRRRTTIFQDLLLGINAHINHDLAHAVIRAGLDVDCDRCYQDHTRMNGVMRFAAPLVRKRVAVNYSRWLNVANWFCGSAIDSAVASSFERARDNAWIWAKALAGACSEGQQRNVEWMISRRAETAGEQILSRRGSPVRSLALLHQIKSRLGAPVTPIANFQALSSLCPLSPI